MLYTNVDDMSPESLGFVMDRLLDKGALDVSFTPAFMKKNRPATRIEVICQTPQLEALAGLLLSETTTIGVRYHLCDRMILKREPVVVETSFGRVDAKKIMSANAKIMVRPEYDACKRIALEHNLPFYQVYEQILAESNPLDGQAD